MRYSPRVKIGNLVIGGGAPIAVQSMTNTATSDVAATVEQILQLYSAGSELVRFTVRDELDAQAVPSIVQQVREAGCYISLVGDFHYNGHLLLTKYPECAQALDKYRINPGNVGVGNQHDDNFRQMVEVAIANDKAVRIGVNGGSLDQALLARLTTENAALPQPQSGRSVFLQAMAQSALQSADSAVSFGLPKERIVLSAKVSDVKDVVEVYQYLASHGDYALHIGLTEAGMGMSGLVSSAVAMGILLNQGIGDTIRVSLTPEPGQARAVEVEAAQEILQCLGLRCFVPSVVSCPGCGRTSSHVFQELALDVKNYLASRIGEWEKQGLVGVRQLKVAVMGCIVNGPGEARDANIGISLPGRGESLLAPVYADGRHLVSLRGDNLAEQFFKCLEEYVSQHYSAVNNQ